MTNPLISIITVVYNGVFSLEQTILSVINQTYKNIEYIIIEGGSTDGTIDIVKKYEDKITNWISEPDKGIYDAMNKGLKLATGVFVYFLNSGDAFFEHTTLNKVVTKMYNMDFVYYGDVYMTGIRKLYWGKFSRYKLATGNICHQSIFYPQIIYKSNNYRTIYKVYADYYYNLSIYSQVKFHYLDETIALYEDSGFSVTHKDRDLEFKKAVYCLILKKIGLFPLIYGIMYRKLMSLKQLLVK